MTKNNWLTVHNSFFTNFKVDDFFRDYDLNKFPSDYKEILSTFEYNLKAVIAILSLPNTISVTRTKLLIFDKIMTQELILSTPLVIDDPESKEDEKKRKELVYKKAQERYFKEVYTEQGTKEFWNITYSFLDDLHDKNEVAIAVKELLNQSCILLWSSFEVLSRDFFINYINRNANRINDLLEFLKAKKIYNNIISLDTLVEHSYDISKNMGFILEQNIDFSYLSYIREIYKMLFPLNTTLVNNINNKLLWKINQQRHLLVHKKGIVDKKYSESTDDKTPIGEEIIITPESVKQYLEIIKSTGYEIVNSALYHL
ncbi:MAG: hypothetical protein MUO60_20895 [Clostridiaceae bacterium]|nr:hypothetical protein [Clostridiaceae bacterium]